MSECSVWEENTFSAIRRICLVFICCCLGGAFFCRAGWGGETWTIIKREGLTIVVPPYSSGDILVVKGDRLDWNDWDTIRDERYREPFHLRLRNDQAAIREEEGPSGCKKLLSVSGPAIEYLGEGVFAGCSALRSFDFPNVVSIDYGVFSYCENLETVELPSSLREIYSPFWSCNNLQEIRIAEGNVSFRTIDGSLYDKEGKFLISYPLGKKEAQFVNTQIEGIDAEIFWGSKGNLKHVILPSVKVVYDRTFFRAESLVIVEIPNVKRIYGPTFFMCTSLKEVHVPLLEAIDYHAFKNCESLELFDAPRLRDIADEAFVECRALKSVTCPRADSVGYYAFGECGELVTLDLRSVEKIWQDAFCNCVSLREIRLGRPPVVEEGAFAGVPGPLVLRVPEEVVGEYTAAYLQKSGYPAGTRVVAAED